MKTELIKRLSKLPPAALYEAAGGCGVLPPCFHPVTRANSFAGAAFTVFCSGDSNLAIHAALYSAKPGDVLMIATGAECECAFLGELMVEAAGRVGLGGIVIDGRVRDLEALKESKLAVFCRGHAVQGPSKRRLGRDSIQKPIEIGDTAIRPGDFICGNTDGVVVLPPKRAQDVAQAAECRIRNEARILGALGKSGEPLYKLLEIDLGSWKEQAR